MTTCRDCKFYEPSDQTKGICFGYVVPADRNVEECPAKAFQPRTKGFTKR